MENPQDQTINKHSREHPTKKQEPLSELNNTLGEIDNAIKDFDGASLTSEQQSRLREIKGKIIKRKSLFGRAFNFLL